MSSRLRSLFDFIAWLRTRLTEDRLLEVSGSLTFTTLLALVPVVTVALMVFAAVPAFADFWSVIRSFILANLVPTSASRVMGTYVEQFAENAGRLTTLGLVVLSVAAIMMMHTIERTFNRIWRVRRARPLIARFLTYWAVLTVGPLLVGASLSLTSWLIAQSAGAFGAGGSADRLLLKGLPWALTCLALAFVYRTVPNRRVQALDAMLGGVLAGTLFEGTKVLFGIYIRQVPTFKLVYGTFASFPIFLTWIYVSWLVVLIGAELAAALPYLRDGSVRVRRWPGSIFLDVVRMLERLHAAHVAGRPVTSAALRKALRISFDECELLLDRLRVLGWVAPTGGERWVLARSADAIDLAEVYANFVFSVENDAHSAESDLERRIVRMVAQPVRGMDVSLQELFDGAGERAEPTIDSVPAASPAPATTDRSHATPSA